MVAILRPKSSLNLSSGLHLEVPVDPSSNVTVIALSLSEASPFMIRPVNMYAGGARHRCAVCGRTELDDPNLEFRYCSKCNGNYEYCQDHLFTHEHVK